MDIQTKNRNTFIYFECEYRVTSENIPTADIIFSIEQANNLIFYKGRPIPFQISHDSSFSSLIFEIQIDSTTIKDSNFKCYIYNTSSVGSFELQNIQIIRLEKKC